MHARGACWSFHKMTVLGSEWLNNHVLSNSLRTEECFHEYKGGEAPASSKKTKERQAKICIKWQYYRVWMNEKPRRKQFIPLLSRCRREKYFSIMQSVDFAICWPDSRLAFIGGRVRLPPPPPLSARPWFIQVTVIGSEWTNNQILGTFCQKMILSSTVAGQKPGINVSYLTKMK